METVELPQSKITYNQKRTFTKVGVEIDGDLVDVIAEVRYDDECRNGHNTFAITGSVYLSGKPRIDRNYLRCGCVHEAIEKAFPELKHLIKWHLVSSDGPMHYLSNAMYHARDRSHAGVEIGAAVSYSKRFTFNGVPLSFDEPKKGFWQYLDTVKDYTALEVVEVPYDGRPDSYKFSPYYSITGFDLTNSSGKWYSAPFKSRRAASEFLHTLVKFGYTYIQVPIKWCEAVTPNLEAARRCAVWPDAELKDFTKENLEARLPAIQQEFKQAILSLGFEY
jgi:hypothetical protein